MELAALKDEVQALKESLVAKAIISEELFLSSLHRLRFRRVCQQHPLQSPGSSGAARASLAALGAELLQRSLGAAGNRATAALCACSRSLGAEARRVLLAAECQAAKSRGQIFVCGGYDGTRFLEEIFRFDPRTSTWGSVPPLSVAREASAAAVVDGRIVVCGGFDGLRQLNRAESFDPGAGTWQELPPMRCRRSGACAAASDGLVICGGFDGEEYLSSVERFKGGRWEFLSPMAFRREGACCAALGGGGGASLYVCGGNDGSAVLDQVERLKPGSGWETLPPMNAKRDGACCAALRGRIWVCGGFDGQQSLSLSSTECFEPHRGWRLARPMLARRAGAGAAAVGGQLYVLGGYDGAQNLADCERFDLAQGMWELLPAMQRRRGYCAGAAS